MSKILSKTFLFSVVLCITLFSAGFVFAAYDKFSPGESITISEFVYNDDFTPYTSSCTLLVYKPNGDAFALPGGATMSQDDTTGRHYKTFTPDGAPGSTEGIWPSTMSCGTPGVDKSVLDKTFLVGYANALSSTAQNDIAATIWGYTGSALNTVGNAISKVWSFTDRLLTGSGITGGNLATETYITSSLGSVVADVSSIKSDVTTLIAQIGTGQISAIKTATDTINWGDVSGLVTTAGLIQGKTDTIDWTKVTAIKTATDTINWTDVTGIQTATDTINWTDITSIRSSQQAGWTVEMSNVDQVSTGRTYRTKVFVKNFESVPTNAQTDYPKITLYNADRVKVVENIIMDPVAGSDGVYEYTYTVPIAPEGLWESIVSTEVEPGKIIQTNDYWTVQGSPAQVFINSITETAVPNISANITITNEGLYWYEYHYEWCVVTTSDNACGGSDDIYYGTGSKRIDAGIDYNTNLTATVPLEGAYYFKLMVYYGTEKSGASRSFTATAAVITPPTGGGGGGGGGGPQPPATTCNGADFNHDSKVNSVDFSILLAFWKTAFPFRNPCVDLNGDNKVNSVDFSILMYQWGTRR